MFLSSLYSSDTEVFTKRGWVSFSNLCLSDMVYSRNESTGLGEWVAIIRKVATDVKEDLVQLTGVSTVSEQESLDLLVVASTDIYVCSSGMVKRILPAGKIHELLSTNEELYLFAGARITRDRCFIEQFKELEYHASNIGKGVKFHSRINLLDMRQVLIISEDIKVLLALERRLILMGYQTMLRENCVEAYSEPMCLLKSSLVPYEGYVNGIELRRNRMFLVRRNGYPCFSGDCILD